MTLIEIRQELERLLAPDAEPPTPEHLQQLATAWEGIRWTFPEYFHPIIDDRLQQLQRPQWIAQSPP